MKKIVNLIFGLMIGLIAMSCAPKGEQEMNKLQGQTESQKLFTQSLIDPTMTFISGKIEIDPTSGMVKKKGDIQKQVTELMDEYSERLEDLITEDQEMDQLVSSLESKATELKVISDKLLYIASREAERSEKGFKISKFFELSWQGLTKNDEASLVKEQKSLDDDVKKLTLDLSNMKKNMGRISLDYSLIIYQNPKDSSEKAKFIKVVDGKEEMSMIAEKDISYDEATGDLKCYVGLKESKEGYVLIGNPDSKIEKNSDDEKTKEISMMGIAFKAIKHSESENEYFVGTLKIVRKISLVTQEPAEPKKEVEPETAKSESPKKETEAAGAIQNPVGSIGSILDKSHEGDIEQKRQDLMAQVQKKTEELQVIEGQLTELRQIEADKLEGKYEYNGKFHDIWRWWNGNNMSGLTQKKIALEEEIKSITEELEKLQK